MDKVQSTSTGQGLPLWERQKSTRGHKSSVEGALTAHRQRVSQRQARVDERLNIAKSLTTRFFPEPKVAQKPMVETENLQLNQVNPVNQMNTVDQIEEQVAQTSPNFRGLDAIYDDAQMTPVSQQALQVIEKDLANPEEAPQDDVPRGSYVDYVV